MATGVTRGTIWLARLDPGEGHEMRKTRPVVILQNDVGNQHSPTTIVAPLTSQGVTRVQPFEVLIASLPQPSKALLNHIRTIDQRRLLKRLGSLADDEQHRIDEAIKISLGLG